MRTPEEFARIVSATAMHELTCSMCAESAAILVRKRDAEVREAVLREQAEGFTNALMDGIPFTARGIVTALYGAADRQGAEWTIESEPT